MVISLIRTCRIRVHVLLSLSLAGNDIGRSYKHNYHHIIFASVFLLHYLTLPALIIPSLKA